MKVKISTERTNKVMEIPFIILKTDKYLRAYQDETEMMESEVLGINMHALWVPRDPNACIEACSGDCSHCDLSVMVQRDPEELVNEFYGFVDNHYEGDPITIYVDEINDLIEFEIPYEIMER